MSIIQGTAKSGGSTGEVYTYPIEDSLRFDGSSYLSRTFGNGGSTNTWTYSSWVKRSTLSSSAGEVLLFAGTVPDDDVYIYLSDTTDTLHYFDRGTGANVDSANKFRDVSAWYHFVVSLNTSTTESIKFYVNGNLVTDFSTSTYSTSAQSINSAEEHRIGNRFYVNDNMHFNGYMANIQFIDGQALNASYFGETIQDIWVPKEYTGSYGTNGFHLDFADSSNIGNDVSGNNNDWTVN